MSYSFISSIIDPEAAASQAIQISQAEADYQQSNIASIAAENKAYYAAHPRKAFWVDSMTDKLRWKFVLVIGMLGLEFALFNGFGEADNRAQPLWLDSLKVAWTCFELYTIGLLLRLCNQALGRLVGAEGKVLY